MKINVNNVEIYYKNAGLGQPVILLHGNGENGEIFNDLTNMLSKNYSVYVVDTRGHGKSQKVKRLHYFDMAKDIKEFIEKLDLKKPILYGFSDGGIIGLILAVKYPELLSKLIISGVNTTPKSIKPFIRFLFRLNYFFTRNDKTKLMLKEPDLKYEELRIITIPVLALAGQHDIVKESDTRQIAAHIKNSTLKILENENHSSYVLDNFKLYKILEPFLVK